MVEFVSVVIGLAQQWGWGVLTLVFLLYQFYAPTSVKPGSSHTKLQRVFKQFHVAGIILEAVAEEHDNLDADMVSDAFSENGYSPDDFKHGDH